MKLRFTNKVSEFTHRLKDTKDFNSLRKTYPWFKMEVHIDNLSTQDGNYRNWLHWDKEEVLEYYKEIL